VVDNQTVQPHLRLGHLNHNLINCAVDHKTVHDHWPRLPDTVAAILGLEINLRILR